MPSSDLNITIRVAGRQAQQQLRAVSGEIKKMQSMVGKQVPKLAAPSSPWSPAIAKQQAKQAAAAATQAANAAARATKQAATQSHKLLMAQNAAQARAKKAAAAQAQAQAKASAAATARTAKAAAAQAQRQAAAANRAAVAAAKARDRAIKQAATQAHKQMIALQKAQHAHQMKVWKQQTAAHKAMMAKQVAATKAANKQMAASQAASAKAKAGGAGLSGLTPLGFAARVSQSPLINAGKNINWVGRQLTYNFTLPLAVAGAGLMSFTMDVIKARTQISKVYGDIRDDPAMLRAELDALNTSFELLSSRFGVHQVEVLEIAAAWAAAGSAGAGLAENVRTTLETMILGDIDAQTAVEGLIAIQAQWGFSTQKTIETATGAVSEMTLHMAELNAIENATGISTEGLIQVIQRVGGSARTAGLDFRETGALAAALVPATGDAAQAGTALRSIIASLMSPTAAATEALKLMGITVTDPSWIGQDVMGRLRLMAEHFDGLSDSQKGVVSSVIATKWQVSRFDVLMREILNPLGYFQKSLDVTEKSTEALAIRNRELNEFLESSPKRWDIMTNVMRNSLSKAFLPLIPAILSIVSLITRMIKWFTDLSPATQKWILTVLVLIAILGPLASMLGSIFTLLGLVGSAFKFLAVPIWWLIKSALFPLIETLGLVAIAFVKTAATAVGTWIAGFMPLWLAVAIVAAVVAAILLILNTDLEEEIWDIMKSIGRAFSQLPKIIADVFIAVVKIIWRAMAQIVEALSYLNPFARHSPSLVDNVKEGVATILDEYAKFNQIPRLIGNAVAALQMFNLATRVQGRSFRERELQEMANEGAAGNPLIQAAGNALVQDIIRLEAALPGLAAEIRTQEYVVLAWERALKAADARVEAAEEGLRALEEQYSAVGDAIADAEARISDLARTPILGLQALEDQIFANQHAQNLLNMELLEFERQGIKIEELADKYAEMAGEIELLRGMQAELREAGAGSDVLAWYDQQIAAIQAQRGEMSEVEKTIKDIEDRLEALDLERRFLDLTKAINFDPLERQIDQIVNRLTEMPFDEIVGQILAQQALVAQLKPQYEALGAAVEAERAAVEALKKERDGIQDQLDAEEQKLQDLQSAYSDIEGLIRDMEAALSDFAQSVKKAADETSRLEDLFNAAADFDFEDFGGGAALGREGFLADIEEFNRQLQEELEKALASMEDLDLVKPLEEAWEKVKKWWRELPDKMAKLAQEYWPLAMAAVAVALVGIFLGGIPLLIVAGGLMAGALLYAFWDDIETWLKDKNNWMILGAAVAVGIIGFVIGAIPALIVAAGLLVGALLAYIWEEKDNIYAFWTTVGWDGIKGLFAGMWEGIKRGWLDVAEFLDWLWENIKEFFGVESPSKLFFGLGEDLIRGLINGLASMMTKLWNWFVGLGVNIYNWAYENIVAKVIGAIEGLPGLVLGIFNTMWENIKGVWEKIGPGLQFIWDNSIAPIWNLFKWAFEHVVKPAFDFLLDNVIRPIMEAIFNAIKFVWNNIAGVIETGINFFGSAWNKIAGAVNAVTKFLGLGEPLGPIGEVKIDRIQNTLEWPKGGQMAGQQPANAMAAGGVVPNQGGVYNAPTAIVGEGSKLYPEFVIPTDPRYRDRAFSLMQSLGTRLMQAGGTVDGEKMIAGPPGTLVVPKTPTGDPKGGGGGGNIFSNIVGAAQNAISSVGGVIANGAIRTLWAGPSQLARLAIDQIPVAVMKTAALKLFGMVDEWVTHIGTEWDSSADAHAAAAAAAAAAAPGAPAGSVPTPAGGAGSWRAIVEYLTKQGIPHRVLSTYRPGAVTRTTGNPSWHGMDRAVDLSGPEGMVNFSASSERIAAAVYNAFKGQLHELIWGGTQAYNVFNGQSHSFGSTLMREHYNHVHVSLAEGGRFHVPRTPGGVNMNVAEGRAGEEVQVLPVDETQTGGTTIIINGNLEFPNITDGDDAKNFIENLRALAMQ